MKISPAVRAGIAAGTSAGLVVSLMFLGHGGNSVKVETSSADLPSLTGVADTTSSSEPATSTTAGPTTTEPKPDLDLKAPTSTTTTAPRATTTRPPTSTTTATVAPATTTTTLPAPGLTVDFQPGSSSAALHYTTPRNYDVSGCFVATLQDGSTTRFVSTFHGFAPPGGFFSVYPYPPLGPMTDLKLVNFTYAAPSYDPLPDPCAGP